MTTTANHIKTSNPYTTAELLLITEFGGLLFGLTLSILPILLSIIPGSVIFPTVSIFFQAVIAILVLLPVPILLAYYLTNEWEKGIIIGLCAVAPIPLIYIAELGLLLLLAVLSLMFHSLDPFVKSFTAGILAVLPSASVISIIILLNPKRNLPEVQSFLFRISGIRLGFVIGAGLSVVSVMLFTNPMPQTSNPHVPEIIIPSLIWTSIIYFSQIGSNLGKAISFIVWVLLILVSFAFAFMAQTLFK